MAGDSDIKGEMKRSEFKPRENLPGGLHDQNHARTDHTDVAVVALEGGDGGSIGVGDGVEGFATFHFVMNHCGWFFVHR